MSKDFLPCTLWLFRCFQFLGMIWKTEHGGENPDFDFVLFLFTLLTEKPVILHPVSVVATSFFNCIGSLEMVFARFRWL